MSGVVAGQSWTKSECKETKKIQKFDLFASMRAIGAIQSAAVTTGADTTLANTL